MTQVTKGVILAAGKGSRLYPLTYSVSKQLMPVFDKPLIYYSISLLMGVGIRDIAIVCNPRDITAFEGVVQDGRQWGICITLLEQTTARGVADAPIVAKDFLNGSGFVLCLGDNFFYGHSIQHNLKSAIKSDRGASVFTIPTQTPERFGVAQVDAIGRVVGLEEKPKNPKSNLAVTGLYVFDGNAALLAEWLQPSDRGELEIVDLLTLYLNQGLLSSTNLGDMTVWSDLGTHSSLLETARFVEKKQKQKRQPIGSPEYTALQVGLLDFNGFARKALALNKTDYGELLVEQIRRRSKSQSAVG